MFYYKVYYKQHFIKRCYITFYLLYNILKGLEEVFNIIKSLLVSCIKEIFLIKLFYILLLVCLNSLSQLQHYQYYLILQVLPHIIIYRDCIKGISNKVVIVSVRALNIDNNVVYFTRGTKSLIGKLASCSLPKSLC